MVKNGSAVDGKLQQVLATICVNLLGVSYGMTCGWTSAMIPRLRSSYPPVGDAPMSEEGASWLGGFLCLGGMLASTFCGGLVEKIGRKRFGYVAGVPAILSWLLSVFATSHSHLFVARFLAGMAGAMATFLTMIYVSEIASEEVRGALGSVLLFAINVGVLLAFVAGVYLPYLLFNICGLALPCAFLVAFFFMPETPVYLLRKRRIAEAVSSLTFLRGNNKIRVDQEISSLQSAVGDSDLNPQERVKLLDLFKDRATLRGLIISFSLMSGQQLCGIFAMISYAQTIFAMSGSGLSPQFAAIIIGLTQLVGSYLSLVLMERAGRRPLVLVSCAGMAVSHYTVATFCHLLRAEVHLPSYLRVVPVLALSVYMVAYCLGMGPIPFIVSSEIFRVNVVSLAGTLGTLCLWVTSFLVIKTFGPLMELVGIENCFLVLGTCCAGSFAFSYLMLPETKGRRREDIVEELAGNCAARGRSADSHETTRISLTPGKFDERT